MSSPRLGVVRRSMLTNPRIIKAPLGQTRSRGLSVPVPDVSFGLSNSMKDGGVAEALSSWGVQSRPGSSARPVPPDFVSLNRDAVKSGLVTSKELNQYRALVGGARRQNPAPRQQKKSPAVASITLGVTTRPPSPLSDLLSHQYARRWFDEQLSKNRTAEQEQPTKVKPGLVPDTRTSLMRRSRRVPVTQTPVTEPPFSQVPPALDTFRDPEAGLQVRGAHQGLVRSGSRRGAEGL